MRLEALPINRSIPEAARSSEGTLRRWLLLAVGLLLPLISLTGLRSSFSSESIIDRVAPVDAVLVVLVGEFVLARQFKLHAAAKFYLFALLLALTIGVFRAEYEMDQDGMRPSIVEFLAIVMAFLYLTVGYNAGFHPRLAKMLLLGVALGVLWEGVIVFHDWLVPMSQQWYPSNMVGRVNGTFRVGAQLGVYGMSASGILLTLGWTQFRGTLRIAIIALGMAAVSYTIAGSRRSAIISMVAWLLLYLIIGARQFQHRGYILSWVAVVVGLGLGYVYRADLESSFTGERLAEVTTAIQPGQESFILEQFDDVKATVARWFPFGMGFGRGILISSSGHEFHDGYFALLIEAGALGLVAFCALLAVPMFRPWPMLPSVNTQAVRYLVISFVLAAMIMMGHNRMFRDRGFMLYLGLASSLFLSPAQDEPASD